jgi:hypothetical protein
MMTLNHKTFGDNLEISSFPFLLQKEKQHTADIALLDITTFTWYGKGVYR